MHKLKIIWFIKIIKILILLIIMKLNLKRYIMKHTKKLSRAFHDRNKDNEEYKQRNREKAKKSIRKN